MVDQKICIIILALQLFSVVMCKNLMVKIYVVLTWKFFDLAFSPFVQCSMFSVGSMLHRLNKANFRLFIYSFICGEEIFVKLFADWIGQVANISNRTRPHEDEREHICNSSVHF